MLKIFKAFYFEKKLILNLLFQDTVKFKKSSPVYHPDVSL